MPWSDWADWVLQLPAQMRALMVAAPQWWSDLSRGMQILLGYTLSVIGGWVLVGAFMSIIRKTVPNTKPGPSFAALDLWVGGTERCIATTLILFAPNYLASFIGAWIALKFAAHWKRREPDTAPQGIRGDNSGGEDAREQAWKYVTTSSLLFLVGSVFSFAVAVACGLLLNPDALKVWAAHSR